MSTTKYTVEHEWLRIDAEGIVTVGITDFAQDQLGDLVYVELPEVGETLDKGEEAAVIESVKTAGEIVMPVTGEIVAVNTALSDEPHKVNEDPMGAGWFFKMKVTEPSALDSLMDDAGYKEFITGMN